MILKEIKNPGTVQFVHDGVNLYEVEDSYRKGYAEERISNGNAFYKIKVVTKLSTIVEPIHRIRPLFIDSDVGELW